LVFGCTFKYWYLDVPTSVVRYYG